MSDPDQSTSRGERLEREYDEACETERKLWAVVRGNHPGTKEHNPEMWAKWLAAAERVRVLGRLYKAPPTS